MPKTDDRTCGTCGYWVNGATTSHERPVDRWGLCRRMTVDKGGRQPGIEMAVVVVDGVRAQEREGARLETFRDFSCASWWMAPEAS